MPPVGFEPTISTGELPQTYASYGAAIGICMLLVKGINLMLIKLMNSGHSHTHTHTHTHITQVGEPHTLTM
jgi:hypothetical protein